MPIDAASALASASPATGSLADRIGAAKERGDEKAALAAAEQFEAYFVGQMMKSMRSTAKVMGSDLFESSATDTWTEQFDAEVAKRTAGGHGLGLARMIVDSIHRGSATRPAEVDGVHRGGWNWPLSVPGSLTSHFGERRDPFDAGRRSHHGLDIAAEEGTPILAAADGVVRRASDAGGYGLLVEIDHGDGIVTRYAHQSVIDVAVGDTLSAGDRIGAVGSTGRSTGPHLHLEVLRDGQRVDPLEFLSGHD